MADHFAGGVLDGVGQPVVGTENDIADKRTIGCYDRVGVGLGIQDDPRSVCKEGLDCPAVGRHLRGSEVRVGIVPADVHKIEAKHRYPKRFDAQRVVQQVGGRTGGKSHPIAVGGGLVGRRYEGAGHDHHFFQRQVPEARKIELDLVIAEVEVGERVAGPIDEIASAEALQRP